MRPAIALVTLLAFGCSGLRYSSRTEMVEVAAAPAPPPTPLPPYVGLAQPPQTKGHRRTAFLIAGTIASLIGGALIIGGAVGLKRQEATNAEAYAECEAKGGFLCGFLDELTYLPYGFMLGFGAASTVTGLVLLGASAGERP